MDGFDESSQEESEICDGRHFVWNIKNLYCVNTRTYMCFMRLTESQAATNTRYLTTPKKQLSQIYVQILYNNKIIQNVCI